jgi:hypothetical protein
MGKLLLLTTAALALLCAIPAHAELWSPETVQLAEKDQRNIETYCAWHWPRNYQMQVDCSNKQSWALRNLLVLINNFLETHGDQQRPIFAAIMSQCSETWGQDHVMNLTCLRNKAAGLLNPVPPLPRPLPAPRADEPQTQLPTVPSTLPQKELGPLSTRIEEIRKLVRQSLPIITRHCGTDAVCRKEQTAAMYSIAAREIANAKALRNPAMYANAALDNDILNSCIVMWGASEDFAATMQCINDAAPTM